MLHRRAHSREGGVRPGRRFPPRGPGAVPQIRGPVRAGRSPNRLRPHGEVLLRGALGAFAGHRHRGQDLERRLRPGGGDHRPEGSPQEGVPESRAGGGALQHVRDERAGHGRRDRCPGGARGGGAGREGGGAGRAVHGWPEATPGEVRAGSGRTGQGADAGDRVRPPQVPKAQGGLEGGGDGQAGPVRPAHRHGPDAGAPTPHPGLRSRGQYHKIPAAPDRGGGGDR